MKKPPRSPRFPPPRAYGYAPLGIEPTAGDARFNTKLRYRFGFGPA